MKRLLLPVIALAAAFPAQASQVYTKLPAKLDPAKAYVAVELGKLDGALLDGTLVLARYDPAKKDIAEPTAKPKGHKGDWPLDNRVFLQKPVAKDKGRRLFLAELDPGTWVIEGANDTAFALGSSTLELTAGTVTDLGVGSIYSDFPEGEKRDVLTTGRLFKAALMGPLFGGKLPAAMPKAIDFRARTATDLNLPPVLAGARARGDWTGEVNFGNHLGGLVNRMGGRKTRPGNSNAPGTKTSGPGAE